MLFNSLEFLLFCPVVFLLYWLVFKRMGRTAQNVFVIVSSYYFYGLWDWKFLLLIAFTSLCSYLSGLAIERARKPLVIVWANVIINIAILGIFKYYDFFAQNFALLFQQMGIHLDYVTLNLVLPVGISFYTFQALSYSIDVYRKKLPATHDIVAFFAFISFFPQLVAGPIERATNLLPQFLHDRQFNYQQAVDGMRQMLWGLFKKMVVADNCAYVVNSIFGNYQNLGGMELLVGAVLFSFQIYGDFSGYSDIAIGTAKLFGINLMTNFRVPYFSRDIAEFWRRWHISLTTWFRDYIYIPLGGSRCPKHKVMRNTAVIFLVSGFWHGANWTFIVWGAYHAILFAPLILRGKNRKYTDTVAEGHLLPSLKDGMLMFCTFALVMIGWVIFRADNITMAWDYLVRMFTHFRPTLSFPGKFALLWVMVMLAVEWLQRGKSHAYDLNGCTGIMRYTPVRWGVYAITFMLCLVMTGSSNQFIYFQF